MKYFPVVEEIFATLEQVGADDIARSERKLKATDSGEQRIGVVNEPEAQAMYALSEKYEGERDQSSWRAEYEANDDEERMTWLLQAARLDTLSDMCEMMFWCHIRETLCRHQTWRLELRKKWTVVRTQ